MSDVRGPVVEEHCQPWCCGIIECRAKVASVPRVPRRAKGANGAKSTKGGIGGKGTKDAKGAKGARIGKYVRVPRVLPFIRVKRVYNWFIHIFNSANCSNSQIRAPRHKNRLKNLRRRRPL